jgi:hypothetical protein
MLSFSFPGPQLIPSVYLTKNGTDSLKYARTVDNCIEIIFTDATVHDGVLYLLLDAPTSVGKRWAVITDANSFPTPHHRIKLLQIWSEPLGLKVFNQGIDEHVLTALHKAMEEHGVSLCEFASQLVSPMFSMESDEIVQKMREDAPHLFAPKTRICPPFCSNS